MIFTLHISICDGCGRLILTNFPLFCTDTLPIPSADTLHILNRGTLHIPSTDTLHTPSPMVTSTVSYSSPHSATMPTSDVVTPHPMVHTEVSVGPRDLYTSPPSTGVKSQLVHSISEPVAILIIFGIIAGIVGIILLISYLIRLVMRKSSVDIQPREGDDNGVPLSSIEQTTNQEFSDV